MKYCNYGSKHKKYHVRLNPGLKQCMAEGCNQIFTDYIRPGDTDFDKWPSQFITNEPGTIMYTPPTAPRYVSAATLLDGLWGEDTWEPIDMNLENENG